MKSESFILKILIDNIPPKNDRIRFFKSSKMGSNFMTRTFQSMINGLRFPLSSFCQDLGILKKVLLNSKKIDPSISELLPHLESHCYKFEKDTKKATHIKKVGVVFSGGQASGGHNVIWGIFDGLKKINPDGELIGFVNGPSGIIDNKFIPITEKLLAPYYNTGGFDLIGSGRTKIETEVQLTKSLETIKNHKLDALIIIGGDDSNTNAAVLANYLKTKKLNCTICGVPKTIDGDLKNAHIETSFGFDTASKLFSELTSNIARDCLSAKKYYHFIKIMGRSASHITLEVALNAKPNLSFITEEITKNKRTLADIVKEIGQMIIDRAAHHKEYGIVLIPEGLIEAVDELNSLIKNLSSAIGQHGHKEALSHLNPSDKALFDKIPSDIQKQLFLDTDPHGNVQVSLIETEKLILALVKQYLKDHKFEGNFSAVCHFFGYEGRSCYPSYFDAIYTYHLGMGAMALVKESLSGYMVSIKNLENSPDKWHLEAIPTVSMIHLEKRKGVNKPVIKKAYVDLSLARYSQFHTIKESLKTSDHYQFCGPLQYFGPFEDLYHPPLILQDRVRD